MSSSVEDEKHEALIEKCGMEGYGAYWVVAEKIAAQIRPECVSTSLTLSWRNWARHFRGTDIRSVKFILRTMADVGLIFLKIEEIGCTSASKNNRSTPDLQPIRSRSEYELVTVDMPNILKYADEYTRKLLTKSRQTPDKLRSDTGFPAVPALPAVPAVQDKPKSESIVTRPKGNGRFTPPTLEDVSEYCKARGNNIDPVKFHAHYTANGWRVGKNPMKVWKAAVVTWERSPNQ